MRHIKNSWVWLLILGIGGVAVIWSLHVRFPDALSSRDGKIDLAHSLLILTFVGAGFIMFRRQTINKMVKNSLIWITLAGLLFVGYSFRNELGFLGNRLLGDLVPTLGQKQGTAMRYPSSANGHFMVEAKIETDNTITRARMLIDTGATDVLINLTDSKRLGFNIDNLKFTKIYHICCSF